MEKMVVVGNESFDAPLQFSTSLSFKKCRAGKVLNCNPTEV